MDFLYSTLNFNWFTSTSLWKCSKDWYTSARNSLSSLSVQSKNLRSSASKPISRGEGKSPYFIVQYNWQLAIDPSNLFGRNGWAYFDFTWPSSRPRSRFGVLSWYTVPRFGNWLVWIQSVPLVSRHGRKNLLCASLDCSSIKAIHAIPYDLVNIQNGSNQLRKAFIDWENRSMTSLTVRIRRSLCHSESNKRERTCWLSSRSSNWWLWADYLLTFLFLTNNWGFLSSFSLKAKRGSTIT